MVKKLLSKIKDVWMDQMFIRNYGCKNPYIINLDYWELTQEGNGTLVFKRKTVH